MAKPTHDRIGSGLAFTAVLVVVGTWFPASASAQPTESTAKGPSRPVTQGAAYFVQNFDGVVPPALPSGWTTSTLSGDANLWVTDASSNGTPPNWAFASNLATVSDSVLVSPTIALPAGSSQLTFQHFHNFELGGFDGGVLEIKIGAGAFQDIIAAGGSFVAGGYTSTISSCCGNPIGGRAGWTDFAADMYKTTVNMPAASAGQNVVLRWRIGSDESSGNLGWGVDTVTLCSGQCGGVELVQNGDFSNGTTGWQQFATPDLTYIVSSVVSGVFEYYRVPPPAGTSNQAVVFQETGSPLLANSPVLAQFDLGNSSSVRKRISVLVLDSNFSDLSVCTFFLAPNAPMRTYQMRTHSTQAWANVAIYFYAASAGSNGGAYRLDNVSVQYAPAQSATRTDCVDPTRPGAPGGAVGPDLLVNGNFNTGTLTPWGTFGTITSQIVSGVFEFVRPNNTPPAGVVLQATNQAMTANQILTAAFQLGNSSGVRKRVTLILGDNDFTDITACTFFIPAGQALSTYTVRTFATQAWANATFSLYAATIGPDQWIRLDNASLRRTPGTNILGTECVEPGTARPAQEDGVTEVVPTAPSGVARARERTAVANDSGDGAALVDLADAGDAPVLLLADVVDLTAATEARLGFQSWLSANSRAEVQVSRDGVRWIAVTTLRSSDGWESIDVDLGEFLGGEIAVRFVLLRSAPLDAWRVADVTVDVTPR